jgi:L-asparaginase
LEETAYFLDLTTTSSKPVILDGAERLAPDSDSDGPGNLWDAIRVAIAPEAISNGVMVVMNGQINVARDITITNTSQAETFRSPEFGELGVVDVQSVRFYRTPPRRRTIAVNSKTQLRNIDIVMSYAGADGGMIRSMLSDGAVQGFVIAGLGTGGVPALMFDAIKEARARGIPVVMTTRVPTGRVFLLSAMKGFALTLKQIGCLLADNLDLEEYLQ